MHIHDGVFLIEQKAAVASSKRPGNDDSQVAKSMHRSPPPPRFPLRPKVSEK